MPAARLTCAGAMRPYWRCGGSWESSCWRPRSGGGPDPRGVAAAALGFQPLGQFLRAVERCVGKHHAELVAAEAGDEVAVAQAGFQRVAELDDELVARLVAEGIVDLLEVVDVQDQQAVGPAVLQGAEQLLLLLVENAPVVDL